MPDIKIEDLEPMRDSEPLITEKDPKPTRKATATKTDRRPVGRPSTKSKEKEAADAIQAFLALFAMGFGQVVCADCAGEWARNSRAISEPLAEIAMQNPKLLEWLNKGGDVAVYFKLAVALAGPARVTYEHHLSGRFARGEEEFDDSASAGVGTGWVG